MAQFYSFDIDKGSDWSVSCEYRDSSGNAVDLTGVGLYGKIRQGSLTGSVVANFSFDLTEIAIGKFKMFLLASTTALLPTGKLFFDVELEKGTMISRIVEGEITIRGEVTY